MNPPLLMSLVIDPVLEALPFVAWQERALLLTAIAIQESGLRYRRQQPAGPARSFWQIEPATALDTLKRCKPVREFWQLLGLPSMHPRLRLDNVGSILEWSDLGACAVAAGILRLTPGKLPEVGEQKLAWDYYLAAWRPGKPGLKRWPKSYAAALEACSTR